MATGVRATVRTSRKRTESVEVVAMTETVRRRDVPAAPAPSARLHLRRHVDLVRVASALCSA